MIGVNRKAASTRSIGRAKPPEDGSNVAVGVKALEYTDANPSSGFHGYMHRRTLQPPKPRLLQAPLQASPTIEQIAKGVFKSPEALLKDCI